MYIYSTPSWYREALLRHSVRPLGSAAEPITLDTARNHLRLDLYGSPLSHPDDGLIQSVYLPAARQHCEVLSGRALAYQEYELTLRCFPVRGYSDYPVALYSSQYDYIRFPIGPARSINSVIYADANNLDVDLSGSPTGYMFDSYTDEGRLFPAPGSGWPATYDRPNAVRIRFNAGYDADGASPFELGMPATYTAAILLLLTHFYENRSNTETLSQLPREIEMGVKALLYPERFRRGMA